MEERCRSINGPVLKVQLLGEGDNSLWRKRFMLCQDLVVNLRTQCLEQCFWGTLGMSPEM